mgnify:CR=1 FL=1
MGDDDKQYTITLDPSYTYSSGDTSGVTVTMPDVSTDYDIDTNSGTFTIDTNTSDWLHDPSITVPEEADIKIGDRSLKTFMDTMEKRMAILQPDPKKLEKFEALQKAYEHYKHLERLCEIDDEDEQEGPNF